MANEPTQGAGVRQTGSNGLAGMRTAGVRPCPSCNTPINVHATVCPHCGEHVAAKEKVIRCRRCRQRASSSLVVCPSCGRDLHPAPTRWLTWGIPLLALLLLAGLLLVQFSRNDPQQWAAGQGERVARLVEALSSRLQPQFSVASIPPGQNPDDPLVIQANQQAGVTLNNPSDVLPVAARPDESPADETAAIAPVENAADGEPAAQESAAVAQETPAAAAAATNVPTAAAEPVMTPTLTPAATETATSAPASPTPIESTTTAATAITTATSTSSAIITATSNTSNTAVAALATPPTRTAAAVRTPSATTAITPASAATAAPSQAVSLLGLLTPTPVPTLAPTATPASAPALLAVYEVQPGDTLFDIARQYDMTVEDLLAANNLAEDDVYTIQPGDELNIPAPTPEGDSTATPGPTPATYTVRSGDTILAIALRLDVTMDQLLAANDMTINDARGLQPGDVLLLPGTEPTSAPTTQATSTPTTTPAPAVTATSTAAPSPTLSPASAMRLDAPRLRSPENNTAVSCSSQGTLNWLAVPSVRPSDVYVVHLGYVNKIAPDDAEEIIWVISQQQPAASTSWVLDNDLCGLAPVTEGKQWRWYVEVAEKGADGLQPVSPASPIWGFAWQ